MTPDVNVLLATLRSDHVHHPVAYPWLAGAVDRSPFEGGLLLFPMVVASFLRLATHPKIFVLPTPAPAAIAFIDALLAAPGVRMPEVGGEWPRFRARCLVSKLKPNDIPDAWLAAAVQQHGDHLATFDAGFRKMLRRSELTVLGSFQKTDRKVR